MARYTPIGDGCPRRRDEAILCGAELAHVLAVAGKVGAGTGDVTLGRMDEADAVLLREHEDLAAAHGLADRDALRSADMRARA